MQHRSLCSHARLLHSLVHSSSHAASYCSLIVLRLYKLFMLYFIAVRLQSYIPHLAAAALIFRFLIQLPRISKLFSFSLFRGRIVYMKTSHFNPLNLLLQLAKFWKQLAYYNLLCNQAN